MCCIIYLQSPACFHFCFAHAQSTRSYKSARILSCRHIEQELAREQGAGDMAGLERRTVSFAVLLLLMVAGQFQNAASESM